LARFTDRTRPFKEIYEIPQPIKAKFVSLDIYESIKRKTKTTHDLIKSFDL